MLQWEATLCPEIFLTVDRTQASCPVGRVTAASYSREVITAPALDVRGREAESCFKKLFYIKVQLTFNAALLPGVRESDSVIHTRISILL